MPRAREGGGARAACPRYGASTVSVRARTRNGTVVELLLEDAGAGYVQKDGRPRLQAEQADDRATGRRAARRACGARGAAAAYALIGVEVVEGGVGTALTSHRRLLLRDGSLDAAVGWAATWPRAPSPRRATSRSSRR